jgi:pyruvate formate lyase activating enzyme
MILAGLDKLSLIDFPTHLSCIVFTQGCSMRCPFCYNSQLIPFGKKTEQTSLEVDKFFQFLKTRVGKLTGVVITGGEPTVHSDLIDFITQIQNLGFAVKLDTNGTNPARLEQILNTGLVDYVAMDIKQIMSKYTLASGYKGSIENIKTSIDLIRNSGVDYEFRTTVVPSIHATEDLIDISKWLEGSKRYYLQPFQAKDTVTEKRLNKLQSNFDLESIANLLKPYFQQVAVRN